MSLPETRDEARAAGSKFFFSGEPCKYGHVAVRYTINNSCKDCLKERTDKRRSAPGVPRTDYLRQAHGITPEEYAALLEATGGSCEICEREFEQTYLGRPVIDHCHTYGKVRQIICGACNQAIGLMRELPKAMRKAADYIEKHNGRIHPGGPPGSLS